MCHISARGASPEPGASLQRIGQLLCEERSNGLPATGMRLHTEAEVAVNTAADCFRLWQQQAARVHRGRRDEARAGYKTMRTGVLSASNRPTLCCAGGRQIYRRARRRIHRLLGKSEMKLKNGMKLSEEQDA